MVNLIHDERGGPSLRCFVGEEEASSAVWRGMPNLNRPFRDDHWVQHCVVVKNTFLEVVPGLGVRPSGLREVRRQVSDPLSSSEQRQGRDFNIWDEHAGMSSEHQQILCLDEAVKQSTLGKLPQISGGGSTVHDVAAVKNCRYNKINKISNPPPIEVDDESSQQQQQLTAAQLMQRVPVVDGQLTSVGSALHSQKKCSPCAFYHASVRCREGVMCAFCHLNHNVKVRIRPCKGKRERYKKLKDHLFSRIENDPEGFNPNTLNLPPSIAEDEILKAKLMSSLADHLEKVLWNRRNG